MPTTRPRPSPHPTTTTEETPRKPIPSAAIPGFLSPDPDPIPTAPTGTIPTPSSSPEAGVSDSGEEVLGLSLEAEPTQGSPTKKRITGFQLKLRRGSPTPEVRAAVYDIAKGLLETVGQLANLRLGHPELYGPTDLFLLDDQDAQAIAGPLANIVARRTPGGIGSNSDAADLITLTIGTGGYAIKNLQRRAAVAQLYSQGAWTPLEGNYPTGAAPATEPAAPVVVPDFPPPPPGVPYGG